MARMETLHNTSKPMEGALMTNAPRLTDANDRSPKVNWHCLMKRPFLLRFSQWRCRKSTRESESKFAEPRKKCGERLCGAIDYQSWPLNRSKLTSELISATPVWFFFTLRTWFIIASNVSSQISAFCIYFRSMRSEENLKTSAGGMKERKM